MARLHSYIRPSINTHPGFSRKKKRQPKLMELSPPTKLSTSGPSRVTRSLHGEVLTSWPIIQKKKLKAKHMKNNFKKMVRNPNSNSAKK
jgi:hypothetical protein